MLFANDTLICTIAELIRCSLTRIDTLLILSSVFFEQLL